MTIKELYEAVGGDYEDIYSRFGNEEMIKMFLDMFLREPSFGKLKEAMEADDMETAFAMAHTVKGVCANIAFKRLQELSSELTEDLRGGKDIAAAKELFPRALACYEDTVNMIKEYKEA